MTSERLHRKSIFFFIFKKIFDYFFDWHFFTCLSKKIFDNHCFFVEFILSGHNAEWNIFIGSEVELFLEFCILIVHLSPDSCISKLFRDRVSIFWNFPEEIEYQYVCKRDEFIRKFIENPLSDS